MPQSALPLHQVRVRSGIGANREQCQGDHLAFGQSVGARFAAQGEDENTAPYKPVGFRCVSGDPSETGAAPKWTSRREELEALDSVSMENS